MQHPCSEAFKEVKCLCNLVELLAGRSFEITGHKDNSTKAGLVPPRLFVQKGNDHEERFNKLSQTNVFTTMRRFAD